MKYALLEGVRKEPEPGLTAICPACNAPVVSKCGRLNIWHWAHTSKKHCDSWWEPETDWHRLWKSYFDETQQEWVQHDSTSGEKHIADIKTQNGLVIEIQNSPISIKEAASREAFYDEMIWIVNGEKFSKRFELTCKLPSPKSSELDDLGLIPMRKNKGILFFRRSKNLNSSPDSLVEIENGLDFQKSLIEKTFDGHWLFSWPNRRTVWFECKQPVFFDFGGEVLFELKKFREDQPIDCVRTLSKKALIKKCGGSWANQ